VPGKEISREKKKKEEEEKGRESTRAAKKDDAYSPEERVGQVGVYFKGRRHNEEKP